MEALLGFALDLWDDLTFLTLMLCVVALIATWLFLAGLPGRIALARKHPEAEAVKYLGYAGLLPTVYPWMQALIWALKPTDSVDIRRFPREEAIETGKEIVRRQQESPDLRLRQPAGAEQLRQSRLGIRRPGQPFGDGRRPGRHVFRRRLGGAWRLPVPVGRYRAIGNADGVRNQVLQGLQSQLSDCGVLPVLPVRGPLSCGLRQH